MDIADFANDTPPSGRLSALAGLLEPEALRSPIDMYLSSVRTALNYGSPARLAADPFIGRLLVLGIVSAAEAYFRGVLSSCMEMCPVAQASAAGRQIHLGGLLWHGKEGFSRSAFEHSSFASKEDLKKVFRDFLSVDLPDANFKSLLFEFEIVCQLRHGIAHGDGLLPGRNAVLLNIPRYPSPVRIKIGYPQLQEVAVVVSNLVVAVNRHLFTQMCERWAVQWRSRLDWEPTEEIRRFTIIWNVFHSKDELKSRQGRSKITKSRCISEIKSQYGLI